MATTAAITLTSADLLSNAIAVSSTATLYKAGLTTGLDQVKMGRTELPLGTEFDLIDATTLAINKANKVYIANKSTSVDQYVKVVIKDKTIGYLYAGDWMFIPWNADDATHDISVRAYVGVQSVEWALFHEGETLPTAS